MENATNFDRYQVRGIDATHIFAFSVVFSESDLKAMIRILNRTNYKMLVFNCDPKSALRFGLKNVINIGQFISSMIGGHGSFTSYIYLKKKRSCGMIQRQIAIRDISKELEWKFNESRAKN